MADKLTIGMSITLYKILESMLFDTESDTFKESDLPFNIRYKIQRNLDLLTKDKAYFESERQNLIKKYGEKKKDDPTRIEVTPENLKEFQEDIFKVMTLEVEHKFFKFTPEEVFLIKDVKAQAYEMDMFISHLVEDPDREEDLNTPIEPKKD